MAGEIAVDIAHRFEGGVEVRATLARTIAPGSILVLFGPSGAGKTTILRAIAGLLRPDRGRIVYDGPSATLRDDPVKLESFIGVVKG